MKTFKWSYVVDGAQEVTHHTCKLESASLGLTATDEAPKAKVAAAKKRIEMAMAKTVVYRLIADGYAIEAGILLKTVTNKQAVAALKHLQKSKTS